MFQRTGRHPDLARGPNTDALPNLPERDLNRQHVFFDLRQGPDTLGARPRGRPPSAPPARERGARVQSGARHRAGRLLVEVFEDAAPLAARFFLNRCREGSSEALQGTCVHRLQPEMAFFFGKSRGCAPRHGAAAAGSDLCLVC